VKPASTGSAAASTRASPPGLSDLPRPLPRRDYSLFTRVIARAFLHTVLRPMLWLLRVIGVWPRALTRGSARMHSQFEGFTPTARDVLVCAYFKSGTNWTMQMALQIAWRGRAQFEHIHDLVPWLEIPARVKYTVPLSDSLWQCCPTQLRVIKTHLPFGKIVYNDAGRYIWVVRDPKDVFVSGYHFIRSIMLGPLMPSVEEWLDLYLSQDAFYGSWAQHLASGWRVREADNVLFLTFEEMKRDRCGAIQRIAALLDVELRDAEVDAVSELASFEHMQANSRCFDTRGLSPPWVDARGKMIRRGRAGGSDELLSPQQQARIDTYWRAQLAELDCDFPYAEHYGGR